MSTNILETDTFSVTRFFGGRYRGVCYQISMAGSPGYVQLTRDEAVLLRSALTDELFGDPSEATPSKENAANCGLCGKEMKASGQIVHGHAIYFCCNRAFAAPAPEVQGTPKFNLETTLTALQEEQDKFAAEHPDIVAAASMRGRDGGSGMAAQNSPVGAPQKETPTMPYGADAQNFGAVPEGPPQKEIPPEKC